MKKIKVGFIDYFLDEWHANNYPQMFREHSGGKYEVTYAYGMIDSPMENGRTNKKWAQDYGVTLMDSIEEVVEKSDVLVVLSPNNPEMHEELCKIPLQSGKLTYIDKTFAPDKQSAERIFEYAEKYATKCFSSSALRFAQEYVEIDKNSIESIYSEGPGIYDNYSIHQIEPIVALMQKGENAIRAKRVMFTGSELHPSMIIEFSDGRRAYMHQCKGLNFKITTADSENNAKSYEVKSDFFGLFIDALLKFYDTGTVPVKKEETIDIIAIRTAGIAAMKLPFTWIEL